MVVGVCGGDELLEAVGDVTHQGFMSPARKGDSHVRRAYLPFGWQELQRSAIIAPALARGLWAVIENMTMVPAAAHAMVLGTWPHQLEVALGCE